MTNLLHIDSSIRGDESTSREITAAFAEAWRRANQAGGYTYRDLAADPIPHISGTYFFGTQLADAQRTPAQRAVCAAAQPIIDEVIAADVVLLGAPMYNFSLPSTLKAWIDHLAVPPLMVDRKTGVGPLAGKRVIVATARGGSYAPGTPRASFDFQEPYVRAVFGMLGLDKDLTFVHTELTMAGVVQEMAQLRDKAASSREASHRTVAELATAS